MTDGFVFNIQRYSVHDGPGIRTVVFLNGCPMRCAWCSNPESWDIKPTISFNDKVCVRCGECAISCKKGAITFKDGPIFNASRCDNCGICEENCVGSSIKIFGKLISSDEVINEALKDKQFYARSGGGLTLSGGEALMQPKFTKEILQKAKMVGLNTNIETTAFASREIIEDVLCLSDLIFCDFKHIDDEIHKRFTGQGNALILDNIRFMSENGYPLVLRIPLIPGFNDDEETLRKMAKFIGSLKGIRRVGLLPYHNYGKGKYELLKKKYPWDVEKLSDEEITKAASIIRTCGYDLEIGD